VANSILKVNGSYIKNPMSIEVAIYDLDSEDGAGRNQNGDMTRDRKAVKRKVNCTFPPMLQDEMSLLLNAVTDVFFQLTYPDPKDGTKTITAYVGDRSVPVYRLDPRTNQWMYTSFKMNFIER